jgi:hypothetical protein
MNTQTAPSLTALALAVAVGALGCPAFMPPCDTPDACGPRVLATGTVPNDVQLGRCGDAEVAIVPASFDARVDAIALEPSRGGEVLGSVFLGVGTNPWSVAGSADRLWVTLWSTGEVALINTCTGEDAGRLDISEVVEVSPPVTLRSPIDADGDGATESEVTRMTLRSPQAVVARGDEAWVGFTNLLEASASASEPPRLGPGVVARLAIEGGAPVLRELVTVPCSNPQGLALSDDALWVSCSGPIGPDSAGRQGAHLDGALISLDPNTLEVQHHIDMARFAPATPALAGDTIVVGSLVTSRVALLSVTASSLEDAHVVTLPGAEVDSVFEVAVRGTRVDAPVFSRDRLFSFDLDEPPATVSESNGRLIGAGGDPPRGLLALDRPPGFSVSGLALLTLSAEVVVLNEIDQP